MTLEQRNATQPPQPPEHPPFPEIDLPELERRYALMYLIAFCGELKRSDITQLSRFLYSNAMAGRIRSLREVSTEAGILPADRRGFRAMQQTNGRRGVLGDDLERDVFLNHVVPRYSAWEMEWEFNGYRYAPKGEKGPYSLEGDPLGAPGFVDMLAGSGTARPLILDIYAARAWGNNIAVSEAKTSENETYRPTDSGRYFADAIQYLYNNRAWPKDFIIVMEQGIHEQGLHRYPQNTYRYPAWRT